MFLNNTLGSKDTQENDKGNFLKLIHVGNLSYESESDSHGFLCSFQPWLFPQNSPQDSTIITRIIGTKLAGSLICGSIWIDSLQSRKLKHEDNSESQIFELGTNKISAAPLEDLVNPKIFIPESFWLKKGGTLIISVKFYDKTIIIPYFELLRVLFYQASSRLTKFFFSFLPLDSLCRPIIFPKEENSWYGAFYVSSVQLSAPEARILGGLLFNQSLKNIFDLSQTHWLFPNSTDALATKSNRGKKSLGKLDISILFSANGRNFSYENNKYFWVDSLEILSSPYNFDEILFHPLQPSNLCSFNTTLPLCSDLLSISRDTTKLPKLYKCLDNTTRFNKIAFESVLLAKKTIERKKLSQSPFPYVMCGLPWAATPARKKNTYWLDDFLKEKATQIDKNSIKKRTAYTHHLLDIIITFEKRGYAIEYLTLNNPNNVFGKNISVFPINCHPPSPIHSSIHVIKICTIISIKLAYGKIFIIQPYPEDNPDLLILCQKQDLNTPNELEWNNLFNIITPIHNSTQFYEFFKRARDLNRNNVSTNSALLAVALPSKIMTEEFCILFSNHVLSKFKKRLQFYLASVLKYPKGITYAQQKEIILSSKNICKAPDSMWVTKIFSYWS